VASRVAPEAGESGSISRRERPPRPATRSDHHAATHTTRVSRLAPRRRIGVERSYANWKIHFGKLRRQSIRCFGTPSKLLLLAFAVGASNMEAIKSWRYRYGHDN
jgi:hypothetical protein